MISRETKNPENLPDRLARKMSVLREKVLRTIKIKITPQVIPFLYFFCEMNIFRVTSFPEDFPDLNISGNNYPICRKFSEYTRKI